MALNQVRRIQMEHRLAFRFLGRRELSRWMVAAGSPSRVISFTARRPFYLVAPVTCWP